MYPIKVNDTKEKNSVIRNNPNVTINQLMVITGLSKPGVRKNLKQLKVAGIIARIGANKNGYWVKMLIKHSFNLLIYFSLFI